MDKMNYNFYLYKIFGEFYNLTKLPVFNDSLFMPSVWKNGILGLKAKIQRLDCRNLLKSTIFIRDNLFSICPAPIR